MTLFSYKRRSSVQHESFDGVAALPPPPFPPRSLEEFRRDGVKYLKDITLRHCIPPRPLRRDRARITRDLISLPADLFYPRHLFRTYVLHRAQFRPIESELVQSDSNAPNTECMLINAYLRRNIAHYCERKRGRSGVSPGETLQSIRSLLPTKSRLANSRSFINRGDFALVIYLSFVNKKKKLGYQDAEYLRICEKKRGV